MPEIVRLSRCKICIYADDHMPAHFHVRGPGWDVSVSLKTLAVLRGDGGRAEMNEAVRWAEGNRIRLWQEWRKLNERD